MKRTTVRSHLRRTKRGPKVVRRHPRMVHAKMAEFSSQEERDRVALAAGKHPRYSKYWKALKDAGLTQEQEGVYVTPFSSGKKKITVIKPFKRAEMAKIKYPKIFGYSEEGIPMTMMDLKNKKDGKFKKVSKLIDKHKTGKISKTKLISEAEKLGFIHFKKKKKGIFKKMTKIKPISIYG